MTLRDYIESLRHKTVAVIGIGVSNTPLLELLLAEGIRVTACDKRSREQMGEQAEHLELFDAAHGLTPREAEVLKLVCDGLNNPAIAENLCISEHTVKRHMNSIFQKSGAANRYELITNVLSK